jgi:hypothetical protein
MMSDLFWLTDEKMAGLQPYFLTKVLHLRTI